ncbi:vegetative incompatibility HET-E-1 [Pyrenophora seminiperda CCB06]|uniref:Vegetative incompatibility HET-E-1 n=1 Tax=Pyrenophora seminiperda CCB06 TaxID=1302712 RepID=A0A3M7LXR8_9PLEO|nr:vegetative incompatibility HET-E-1 [Pyrenophora seminiperda CCB06]
MRSNRYSILARSLVATISTHYASEPPCAVDSKEGQEVIFADLKDLDNIINTYYINKNIKRYYIFLLDVVNDTLKTNTFTIYAFISNKGSSVRVYLNNLYLLITSRKEQDIKSFLEEYIKDKNPLSIKEIAKVVTINIARDFTFNYNNVLEDLLEVLDIYSSLVTIIIAYEKYFVLDRIRQELKRLNLEKSLNSISILLYYVVSLGLSIVTRLLLNIGANVNIVKILLNKGAKLRYYLIRAPTLTRRVESIIALIKGYEKIVKILLNLEAISSFIRRLRLRYYLIRAPTLTRRVESIIALIKGYEKIVKILLNVVKILLYVGVEVNVLYIALLRGYNDLY